MKGFLGHKDAHILALGVGELGVEAFNVRRRHRLAGPEGALRGVARHEVLELASHESGALARLHVQELYRALGAHVRVQEPVAQRIAVRDSLAYCSGFRA